MKALLMEEYNKLKYTDVAAPEITKRDEILVKVRAVSICGSDVHGFDGSTGRRKPPIIMGHEASGEIAAIGTGVTKFGKGDRITFDSTIYCGSCIYCRDGIVNLCENRTVLGVSCDEYRRHGAFAEYVVVPERICYSIPDELSYEEAAMTEPAAVAAHAIRITQVGLNETIAIVGAGLIGLLLLDVLKVSVSGKIIALDTDANRLGTALGRGASAVVNPADFPRAGELKGEILRLNGGKMADRVFDAVGITSSIATSLSIVRKGGSVTLIGNLSPKVEIPLQYIVSREISLLGSCATSGEYPLVLDLIAGKKIDASSLISKKVPLSDGQMMFDKLRKKEDNLLKVVLIP